MARAMRAAGLMSAMVLLAARCVAGPPDSHAAALVEDVTAIPPVGTVGQVAVWGPEAFAVVVGKEGKHLAPIVGAGALGKGRVMAWAHSYGSTAAAAKLSTGRLLVNSCRWASGKAPTVKAALLDSDLTAYLKEQGIEAAKVEGGETLASQLEGATVLLCGRSDLTAGEIEAVTRFVRGGGGFVCFACPWGWAQVRHKEVGEIPLNRVLEGAGVAFVDGYSEPTKDGAFEISGLPGDEFHAGRALDILTDVESGKRPAGDKTVKQAGVTATAVAGVLPKQDRFLRPRIEELLRTHAGELAPTPAKPLKVDRALERALLAAQLSQVEALPPAAVKAHPSAAGFPGEVPAGTKEVKRTITIDLRVPKWHSTGLYAAPGQVITVTPEATGAEGMTPGLLVRIGCHTDELWHHDEWKRVPRISRAWPIAGGSSPTRVASPFGGLIYVEVPEKSKAGEVRVEISGAVEAPLFVLGRTTNQEWTTRVRDLPGPWAELASERVILSIPSEVARKIDDPTAIMEHWVRVLDADADLAGITRERPCPQRYVADVQISAGYMHSGYPIMTHLDAAAFMTDKKGLVDSGWGPYHEMGHNHQEGAWTFEGTGEVTCNIFTLYVLETVCGVEDASREKVFGADAVKKREKYFAGGRKLEQWKSDPFLALQMYAQVRLAFGWDVYKKVFAEYRTLKADERPKGDQQERDQWMVRLSRACGRNLGPFFEAWGVPTSAAARESVRELPEWMPEEMRGT